ncbi:MAG: LON peptidase substrate-binding domain-containing protein [Planctomycetes bacterium]|nr:LON peptidase substrate-binding domain-containing protein [Planctomycetota bacterium]
MNEDKAALQNFKGTVRLFPLPNLVLFPHALQPLHIFEPRYRKMTADALDDDKLIALVLLQPGWEQHYDQAPPIHKIACLGRIIADQVLEDGRYNLLLRGISRIRIIEEVPLEDKPYRSAQVELVPDDTPGTLDEIMALRTQLRERILPKFGDGQVAKQLAELFHSELSLGALSDVLTFALPVPIERKQRMLEEVDERKRANMLLEGFELITPPNIGVIGNPHRKFPPDFSPN